MMDKTHITRKYLKVCCFLLLLLNGCSGDDSVDCSTLTVEADVHNITCSDYGWILLKINEGDGPYKVVVNERDVQEGVLGLYHYYVGRETGDYRFDVTDAKGCRTSRTFRVENDDVTFQLSVENLQGTSCGENNGSFDVVASGGDGNLTYRVSGTGNSWQESNRFEGLSFGEKVIHVRDGTGCRESFRATIPTGIDFVEIKPIIENNCALSGCHDGSNSEPNFALTTNIIANAEQIAARSKDGSMPPGNVELDEMEIERIQCWVSDMRSN